MEASSCLSLGLVMLVFCGPPLQVLSCSHVVKVFVIQGVFFPLQVFLYRLHHACLCFTGLVICILSCRLCWTDMNLQILSCRLCWTDLSCFTGLVTCLVIQALSCMMYILLCWPCARLVMQAL